MSIGLPGCSHLGADSTSPAKRRGSLYACPCSVQPIGGEGKEGEGEGGCRKGKGGFGEGMRGKDRVGSIFVPN